MENNERIEYLGDHPFVCTKTDKYDEILEYGQDGPLDITNINKDNTVNNISIEKNVNMFPSNVIIGKHLYSLVAKSILVRLDYEKDTLHNEIIIKSMETNTFYRISKGKIIKCNDPHEYRTISNYDNDNYNGNCGHHSCFDRFVDYAIYLRIR